MSTPNFVGFEWEERPYGARTVDGYLRLDPEKNTTMGADPKLLSKFTYEGVHGVLRDAGVQVTLRDHPDTVWERVKHLGYFSGEQDDAISLLYQFKPREVDGVVSIPYSHGDRFYSVRTVGDEFVIGRWHRLVNDTSRPIVLKIDKLNREAK